MQIKQYAPLEIARSFALRHNLTTMKMWLDASEQEGWPEIMPKRPTNTYGCKWSDILAPKTSLNSKFLSYEEAVFTIKHVPMTRESYKRAESLFGIPTIK